MRVYQTVDNFRSSPVILIHGLKVKAYLRASFALPYEYQSIHALKKLSEYRGFTADTVTCISVLSSATSYENHEWRGAMGRDASLINW